MVAKARNAEKRYQFEPNAACPSDDCGFTCATFIAGYYLDNPNLSIGITRHLVTPYCAPATFEQQSLALARRGVPNDFWRVSSVSALHSLIRDSRRPVILLMPNMGLVPAAVRGHDYTGRHAIVAHANHKRRDGTHGVYVLDPDFSPPGGYRPDPTKGLRFYSNSVLRRAWLNTEWAGAAIVPRYRKAV